MSTLATKSSSVRCQSLAAHCAAAYPRYGEGGRNLARGCGRGGRMCSAWLEIAAIALEKNPMGVLVSNGVRRSAFAANHAAVASVLSVLAGLFLPSGSAPAQG